MTHASYSSWNAGWNGAVRHGCGRPPGRALEIAGIVLAFIFFWPAALAYLVWKFMGYPVPNELKAFYEQNFSSAFESMRRAGPAFGFASTGNAAFDEYRRRELERLEEERRRLHEEAKAFAEFVEELKRAKDREEFDAFMARRRGSSNGATSV
jgi:hypothetical protein